MGTFHPIGVYFQSIFLPVAPSLSAKNPLLSAVGRITTYFEGPTLSQMPKYLKSSGDAIFGKIGSYNWKKFILPVFIKSRNWTAIGYLQNPRSTTLHILWVIECTDFRLEEIQIFGISNCWIGTPPIACVHLFQVWNPSILTMAVSMY